jgi:hypothetical protein
MAMFEPEKVPKLVQPHLPSTLGLTTSVTIVPDLNDPQLFTIQWIAKLGATKYVVYASPSPITRNKFQDLSPSTTQTNFRFPIVVPDDLVIYIWVSYINARGQEIFIQDEPVYISNNNAFETNPLSEIIERDEISGEDMKFYVEEIRRRNLAMIQNDGEDYFLYIRKMFGQPCVTISEESGVGGRVQPGSTPIMTELGKEFDRFKPDMTETNENKDPEYQSHMRCMQCLGTSIAGGYYPKIRVRLRYGNIPKRVIKMAGQGIEFSHDFNSWTIWHPRLKERDVMVRLRTGERFTVKERGQSEWRGIPLHQEFNMISEPRTSMIYEITDDRIKKALEDEGAWNIASWDWGLWQ